jgi:hypothetical protein
MPYISKYKSPIWGDVTQTQNKRNKGNMYKSNSHVYITLYIIKSQSGKHNIAQMKRWIRILGNVLEITTGKDKQYKYNIYQM